MYDETTVRHYKTALREQKGPFGLPRSLVQQTAPLPERRRGVLGFGVRLARAQGHVARQRHLGRWADELRRPGCARRRLQMPREEGAGLVERVHGLLRAVAIAVRGPEGVAGAVVA